MSTQDNPQATAALPPVSAGKTVKTLLGILWRHDKGYFAVMLLLSLAGAAASLVNLLLPKMLLDGVQQGWGAGRFVQAGLLFAAVKYLAVQALAWLTRREKQHNYEMERLFPMLFAEKTTRLNYPALEDPAVLDLKERALFPVTNYGALMQLFSTVLDTFKALLTLVGLSAMLAAFSWWFVLALLILCAIAMALSGRFMRYMRQAMQEMIPVNRRYGYYANAATQAEFQKEFRLYGLNTLMRSKVSSYTDEITTWLHRIYVRQGNYEALQALITALMRFIAYGYAAVRALTPMWGPQIGLGDFSVVVLATENFFSTFMQLVTGIFTFIQTVSYLVPFCQYLALPEAAQPGGAQPGPMRTLAFDNVHFCYPHTDRMILDGLSFEITAGEKISIVGLNNAGKSTIVKLICRLFEPQEGRILYNVRDIREYDYDAWLWQLSCVFQDFRLFPFTLRDNIDTAGSGDEARLTGVLAETGMLEAVQALPRGLDTYLNKSVWEEATDFSGGQRQKLAIARSLFRPAEMVILDEPTAALDPLAESEVYEHFHELTRGRTAIFISHRMSSSTFCDRILLLQDGRAAAFDSHHNLMRGHNLYRRLFEAQAQNYRAEQTVQTEPYVSAADAV
ncbi:MAG: ABC transporter ATP-binding protein [Clostridiales bacterium]|nr:ABC transporter ATP-binding protein [Clostridiales bacterium]